MLQNRVDPSGNLIKTSARGTIMGNRGVLHNPQQEIVRPFKLHAWITCQLSFKGRSRTVMSPNRWTELFFLDEATAFAAGHRPCAECRRNDFNAFKQYWLLGNPEYQYTLKTPIREIDAVLHRERINAAKQKVTYQENAAQLPTGAFILFDNKPYLIFKQCMYEWSAAGYTGKMRLHGAVRVTVLTPQSIVRTLRAGYHGNINPVVLT